MGTNTLFKLHVIIYCVLGLHSFKFPLTLLPNQVKGQFLEKEKSPFFNFDQTNVLMKKSLLSFALITSFGLNVPIASAADTVAIGKCLLTSCQAQLAKCILNPKCFANVICLNTCNNRPDESACQIKCGDLFENDVVGEFNSCAVSQKKCVPQKQSDNSYPLPDPVSVVKKFDMSIWNGRWYISAGLNDIFDTFDCQVHFFTSPKPDRVYAKLFWRITEPDGEVMTKRAVQKFVQVYKLVQYI